MRLKSKAILISVCLMVNSLMPVVISAREDLEQNISVRETKISSEVRELMDSSDDKIPVVIFNESIDEYEIEEAVKNRIGFSIEDIEEKYDAPSSELLEELKLAASGSPEEYLEKLMKTHMDLTAEARALEYKNTELYLKTRRTTVAELYSEKNSDFISKNKFEDSDIIFTSQYTPMIVCELSPEIIEDISDNKEVEEILLFEKYESVDCSFPVTDMKDVMGINHINQYLNLTGTGVDIGFYEASNVSSQFSNNYDINMNNVDIIRHNDEEAESDHATWTAAVAAGNQGVAPGAHVYSTTAYYDWDDSSSFTPNIHLNDFEGLINANVDLINVSWGLIVENNSYNYWAKYVDKLISNSKVTVVCATGNDFNHIILSPASAYNCIAVNSFKKVYGNEVLCNYSYMNGNNCLKPDVIADTFGGEGTSTSTPVITGMLALLLQYKPSLAAHPELTKSILMASCHRRTTAQYISDSISVPMEDLLTSGLSDYQGAGIPDMYTMISIASQHSYNSGKLQANSNSITTHFVQPSYSGSNINLSMAYLQDNVSVSSYSEINYDMKLSSGSTYRTSAKPHSSTEMIYSNLFSSNNIYNLEIYRSGNNAANITYGYAWSTNNAKFIPTPEEEGVYFLRNKVDNLYMTADTANSRCSQSSFGGNNNQAWILKYNNISGSYILQGASDSNYGIKIGTSISGSNSFKHVTSGSSAANITLIKNNDGSYIFTQIYQGEIWALGRNSGYTAWTPLTYSESQKWYIESLQWRHGDVNMDGAINSLDYNIVRNHVNRVSLLTQNLQKFLADANFNGIIDVTDMNYINSGLC